jgi:NAD(P)H-dependent FMN reductase
MQQDKIKLLLIVGTSRQGASSITASEFVKGIVEAKYADTFEVRVASPSDFNLPLDGRDEGFTDPKYSELVTWSDAFFIVAPEYNHGYSGSLKRLLDSEYDNYKNKPVAIAGVSSGPIGGARMIESLIDVLHQLGMIVLFDKVYFSSVQEVFKDNKVDPQWNTRVERVLDSLSKWAKVLRENKEALL